MLWCTQVCVRRRQQQLYQQQPAVTVAVAAAGSSDSDSGSSSSSSDTSSCDGSGDRSKPAPPNAPSCPLLCALSPQTPSINQVLPSVSSSCCCSRRVPGTRRQQHCCHTSQVSEQAFVGDEWHDLAPSSPLHTSDPPFKQNLPLNTHPHAQVWKPCASFVALRPPSPCGTTLAPVTHCSPTPRLYTQNLPTNTGLEALRLFPGLETPLTLWHDLAPVSRLSKLKELQLVGYSPIQFSRGAATGEGCGMSSWCRNPPRLLSGEPVSLPACPQVCLSLPEPFPDHYTHTILPPLPPPAVCPPCRRGAVSLPACPQVNRAGR
jgi:hypothetical protein